MLLCLTLVVFWHARNNRFVSFDDHTYVVENPHVLSGLTWEDLRWDFSDEDFRASNWHPLTWLSLQLDAQFFGANPKYFHQTNVLFHAANGVLLFLFLRVLTGAVWRSAAVAALFALHPLRVESVAWVAERKDVLSVFFGLLTLLAYVDYVRRRDWHGRFYATLGHYLGVVILFALGLMAKPMLVTLPFVFLLLDYWPLGRFAQVTPAVTPSGSMRAWLHSLGWLVLEKLPLLLLTVASCIVNLLAQRSGQALGLMEELPLSLRLGNAIQSYALYLGKTFWPANLAVLYPHPKQSLDWLHVAVAAALLVAITAGAIAQRRQRPYLMVGWLWFLGMLVPVSGLTQAGMQALADRYTYLPHVGLLLAVVWLAADLAVRWRLRRAVVLATAAACIACAIVTWIQIGYWHSSVTLWAHCLEATGGNWVAARQLGQAWYLEEHRPDVGVRYLRQEVRLHPDEPMGHFGLALVLSDLGEHEQAAYQCVTACLMEPSNADFVVQLSVVETRWGHEFATSGDAEEAARHFRRAVQTCPTLAKPHFDLGLALTTLGRWPEAETQFREAAARGLAGPVVDFQLGRALAGQKQWSEAAVSFRKALQQQDNSAQGHCYLAHALHRLGNDSEAEAHYAAATRLLPGWVEHNRGTAWACATQPDARLRQGYLAVELAEQSCEATHERDCDCLDTLAAACAEVGQFDRAIVTARKALAVCSSADQQQAIRQRLALYERREPYRQDQGAHP